MTNNNQNYEPPHRYCLDAGFIPKCAFSTNDSLAKFRYCLNGNVFAFIPAGAVAMYTLIPHVKVLPICKEDQKQYLKAHYHIYWSDSIYESLIATTFLEFIKSQIGYLENDIDTI